MSVEIDALPTTKSIGWADALIARLAAGSLGNANRMTHSANGAASAPPVAITGSWFSGGSATTTKPQLLVEAAGATSTGWATAGTGLGVNAASGFAGNLIDAQVNGASKFKVDSSGNVTTAGYLSSANNTLTNAGLWSKSGQIILGSSPNTYIVSDATNTLALRNGANAQAFNIYGTYTSGSVYERMFARYSVANSRYEIGTEHVGASARQLAFMAGTFMSFVAAGTTVLEIDGAQAVFYGGLLMSADNTKDIGRLHNSPFRPRSIYIGTGIQAGAPANTAIAGTLHIVGTSNLVGNVVIGSTSGNANAILDTQSTTKAFMPPRMTGTQRDAIPSPTAGMLVYNATTNKLNLYTTAWEAITSA